MLDVIHLIVKHFTFIFLLIFLTLASSVTYSNEIVINGTATSDVSGITFFDGSQFRLFISKGHLGHHLVIMG